MFRVTLDLEDGKQGDFRVSFRHPQPFTKRTRFTECSIVRLVEDGQKEQWGSGVARCNPMDCFHKDVGRKIALQRAIQYFTREQRKSIWEAYWTKTKKQ